jgi:hypothetical protein
MCLTYYLEYAEGVGRVGSPNSRFEVIFLGTAEQEMIKSWIAVSERLAGTERKGGVATRHYLDKKMHAACMRTTYI